MGVVNRIRLALVEVIRYELESNHDRDGNAAGMHLLDEDAAVMADAVLEVLPKTDDGAAVAAQSMGGSQPPAASSSPTGPGPAATIGGQPGPVVPRRFQLYRHTDISHVSGVGVVAWGVLFPDGSAAIRWHGAHPSTVAWDSVDDAIAVHGHSGATEIRWMDDEPIPLWPAGSKSSGGGE